jgi:hypothetical protein
MTDAVVAAYKNHPWAHHMKKKKFVLLNIPNGTPIEAGSSRVVARHWSDCWWVTHDGARWLRPPKIIWAHHMEDKDCLINTYQTAHQLKQGPCNLLTLKKKEESPLRGIG